MFECVTSDFRKPVSLPRGEFQIAWFQTPTSDWSDVVLIDSFQDSQNCVVRIKVLMSCARNKNGKATSMDERDVTLKVFVSRQTEINHS